MPANLQTSIQYLALGPIALYPGPIDLLRCLRESVISLDLASFCYSCMICYVALHALQKTSWMQRSSHGHSTHA